MYIRRFTPKIQANLFTWKIYIYFYDKNAIFMNIRLKWRIRRAVSCKRLAIFFFILFCKLFVSQIFIYRTFNRFGSRQGSVLDSTLVGLIEYLGSCYSESGLDSNTRRVQVFKIKQKPVISKGTYNLHIVCRNVLINFYIYVLFIYYYYYYFLIIHIDADINKDSTSRNIVRD